jgi:hypothetical protein
MKILLAVAGAAIVIQFFRPHFVNPPVNVQDVLQASAAFVLRLPFERDAAAVVCERRAGIMAAEPRHQRRAAESVVRGSGER